MTTSVPLRVLICPDKFRGTLTAAEAASAMAAGVSAAFGGDADLFRCRLLPLADGGEGTLAAFGGANRFSTVTGPLGDPVRAGWRLDGDRAVVEMAVASGLVLAGGARLNDPLAASTRGTGELILAAAEAGARDILVCVGGSATTDGGSGAVAVLAPDGGPSRLPAGLRLVVGADVRTRFLDAARVFGPQKGATTQQVSELSERLVTLQQQYLRRFGLDVHQMDRSGAAGGLAGGLAALGARLVDGFEAVAAAVDFDSAITATDLVITGEGRLDASSFEGKVVGSVIQRAGARGRPVLAVAGAIESGVPLPAGVTAASLSALVGIERALGAAADSVISAVRILISDRAADGRTWQA